jgi:hypothetical protein
MASPRTVPPQSAPSPYREDAGWRTREGQRPGRVLALAIAAVIAALAVADAANYALWKLSGERYAHEVLNQTVQKARTTPAAS